MTEYFVRSRIVDEGDGRFGLSVITPRTGELYFTSLFSNEKDALDFSERINSLSVSEYHIADIIEDYLG